MPPTFKAVKMQPGTMAQWEEALVTTLGGLSSTPRAHGEGGNRLPQVIGVSSDLTPTPWHRNP